MPRSIFSQPLRRYIASAYRYVLEDAKLYRTLDQSWQTAKPDAMLYGGKEWHPLGESLAVDDVQSPLVRRLLADYRIVVVSSAHLGDEPEQIKSVARELGIGLLSETVKLQPGRVLEEPGYAKRIRALSQGLARLENRRPLVNIRYLDRIDLRVDQRCRGIRAYVDHGVLYLTGTPGEFAAEAASQLVEHFQLSQRGSEIPFLTMALVGVENQAAFDNAVEILFEALGVDRPALDPAERDAHGRSEEDDSGSEEEHSKGDNGEGHFREGVDTGNGNTAHAGGSFGDGSNSGGAGGSSARTGTGAGGGSDSRKHTGTRSSSGSGSVNGAGGGSGGEGGTRNRPYWLQIRGDRGGIDHRQPRDDHREKTVVCQFETARNRIPEAQPHGHHGYDVESRDATSGGIRRIEIKGMSGVFDETAAVDISWTQFEMAMHNQDENIEYWLYVVDQNRSENPGVHPIAWTRHKGELKFLFEGRCWLDQVDRIETSFEATTLDPGDSLTGFEPPEDEEEQ